MVGSANVINICHNIRRRVSDPPRFYEDPDTGFRNIYESGSRSQFYHVHTKKLCLLQDTVKVIQELSILIKIQILV